MTKPKALIFDWDDTIVETFKGVLDLHHQFLRSKGSAENIENKLKLLWGNPLTKVLAELHPESKLEELEKDYYNFVDQSDFVVKPFPYSIQTIKKIKESYPILGVVSSSPRRGLSKTVSRYFPEAPEIFTFIYCADDSEFHKPDPRVFDKALATLKKSKIGVRDILFIGDGMSD